jgi:hypothetical protein
MSSPIQFYRTFQALMREHGIRHVLTSGMACVEYGIQQNTKDTDWIIHPEDLEKLTAMLGECERGLTGRNWRVSYRPLFGAPLVMEYQRGGWTSHLAIHDEADSPEHHLDIFGHPPRVRFDEIFTDNSTGLADRLIVAQMKKTDRDKDWPMIEALCWQIEDEWQTVLHLRTPEKLEELWRRCPDEIKPALITRRPLLEILDTGSMKLVKALAIERMIWEQVNKQRYRRYQAEWKEFLRCWRSHPGYCWPAPLGFPEQHALLRTVVANHHLPCNPLGDQAGRQALVDQALLAVAEVFDSQDATIAGLVPPLEELLP